VSPGDRQGGSSGGLSIHTLVLAAVGSGVAAVVTSTFWPSGSILSAALTPVVVALVSEALRRPTQRVGAAAASSLGRARPARVRGGRGGGGRGRGAGADRPYTVYGTGRPRIRLRPVLITAGLAFVIAVLAITVPERLFGGSVANDRPTTFFPGRSSEEKDEEPEPGSERRGETTTTDEETPAETTTTVPETTTEQPETTTAPETPAGEATTPEPTPTPPPEPTPSPGASEAPN
jgi:hypothetical protein